MSKREDDAVSTPIAIAPAPPIWEMAHMNGSSIFIRHETANAAGTKIDCVFGPFLFGSAAEAQTYDTTHGPYHLLRPMSGQQVRLQQVRAEWAVDAVAGGSFGTIVTPDCVVIGDLLLPLTHKGATIADQSLVAQGGEATWEYLARILGPVGLRFLSAQFIRQMANPGLPN